MKSMKKASSVSRRHKIIGLFLLISNYQCAVSDSLIFFSSLIEKNFSAIYCYEYLVFWEDTELDDVIFLKSDPVF